MRKLKLLPQKIKRAVEKLIDKWFSATKILAWVIHIKLKLKVHIFNQTEFLQIVSAETNQVRLFVSRVGLNICLRNGIHICRVPWGATETRGQLKWSVLMFPQKGRKLMIIRRFWSQKLFKGGNYSRAETIWRNTVGCQVWAKISYIYPRTATDLELSLIYHRDRTEKKCRFSFLDGRGEEREVGSCFLHNYHSSR